MHSDDENKVGSMLAILVRVVKRKNLMEQKERGLLNKTLVACAFMFVEPMVDSLRSLEGVQL